jgi:hypothetical protein
MVTVVSSNQSALWRVLEMAGVEATARELGVLLAPDGAGHQEPGAGVKG